MSAVFVSDRFYMFTPEGNEAVQAMVQRIVDVILAGHLRRTDLPQALRSGMRGVSQTAFGEVYDTEPEWAIVDAVNKACAEVMWLPVSRDDL